MTELPIPRPANEPRLLGARYRFGVQTDTDQVFYFSGETETDTEHPVAPRDRTEMSGE